MQAHERAVMNAQSGRFRRREREMDTGAIRTHTGIETQRSDRTAKATGALPEKESMHFVQETLERAEPETSPVINSREAAAMAAQPASAKALIIQSLIADSVQGGQREALARAFSNADEEKLQKVAEFGTKISVDSALPMGRGGYNTYTRNVSISDKDFADEELLGHNVNHEVMGHAYLAAKEFMNEDRGIRRGKMLLDNLLVLLLGTDGIKKDVRGVKEIFRDYCDRVTVDKASAIKDAITAILTCPDEKISGDAVINSIHQSSMMSQYIKFSDETRSAAYTKEQAINLLGNIAVKAMGIGDLGISRSRDGKMEISFTDLSEKAYGILMKSPVAMAALGLTLGIAGAVTTGALGAGIIATAAVGLLPAPLFYGAGKAIKNIYTKGSPRRKEREIELDGFTARIVKKRNRYTVTLPAEAKQNDYQWSPWGFMSRNKEDYLADAMARISRSPESRRKMKEADPALFDYMAERGNTSPG